MNILVPFANTARAHAALNAAMQMAQPGDTITVVAMVAVPAYYAPDVACSVVRVQTHHAERSLDHARAQVVECDLPNDVTVRYRCAQARDEGAAIVRAAKATGADLILFAGRAGVWAGMARTFGVVAAVARHAPCGVRVVTGAHRSVVPFPAAVVLESVPHHGGVLHLFGRR